MTRKQEHLASLVAPPQNFEIHLALIGHCWVIGEINQLEGKPRIDQ